MYFSDAQTYLRCLDVERNQVMRELAGTVTRYERFLNDSGSGGSNDYRLSAGQTRNLRLKCSVPCSNLKHETHLISNYARRDGLFKRG